VLWKKDIYWSAGVNSTSGNLNKLTSLKSQH
jgi:hypothetical protein